VIGSENGEGVPDEEVKVKKDRDRKKDGKKPISGMYVKTLCSSQTSDRCPYNVNSHFRSSSRKTILRSQLLFHFLLYLKHVERSLASITKDKSLAASCAKPLSSSSDDCELRS